MLSPVKAITAGALVFAIGGVVLIAQPFDRPTAVPGATTDDPAMAPSFFSGTTDDWSLNSPPESVRRDDGVLDWTGEGYLFSWVVNDPRVAGTATMVLNETDYREGATNLAPTGEVGKMGSALIRVVNDAGSWEGPLTMLQLEDPEDVNFAGWLTGSDAYDGLSAYVVWTFATNDARRDLWGHITSEGPPQPPESLPDWGPLSSSATDS